MYFAVVHTTRLIHVSDMMMVYILMNGVALLSCKLMMLSMGLSFHYVLGSLLLLTTMFFMELFFSIMIMYEIREFVQPTNGNANDNSIPMLLL
jgi:hypothetical protein